MKFFRIGDININADEILTVKWEIDPKCRGLVFYIGFKQRAWDYEGKIWHYDYMGVDNFCRLLDYLGVNCDDIKEAEPYKLASELNGEANK